MNVRRLILMGALCLCLLSAAAAAEPTEQTGAFALGVDGGAILLAPDGTHLTEPGQYAIIERLTRTDEGRWLFAGFVPSGNGGGCVVLSDAGERLTEPTFASLYSEDGVIYTVDTDNTIGALSALLTEWVPCEYTQLVANGQGGFLALNSDPNDARPDGVYYIDETGAETATGIKVMFGLPGFSEGLMPVVSDNGRTGYLSPRGEWAISAQYDYAGDFRGGVAEAVIATGAGLIDTSGNWLLTPKYAAIEQGGRDGRMILAQLDYTDIQLIDADTYEVKRRFTGDDIYVSAYFDEDLAVLYLDDCTQLINESGDVIYEAGLDAGFDAWSTMGERMVVRLGAWGEKCVWLYTTGGEVVAGPYRELFVLGEHGGRVLFAGVDYRVREEVDVAAAYTNYVEEENTRTIEVIDEGGNRVIEPRAYIDIMLDESGCLIYQTPDEVGAIDLGGATVAAFDRASELSQTAD